MKWLWLWMLIIAYGIWAVVSIIDIVESIKEWIDENTEEVTDNSQVAPVTKKKWVGKEPFSDVFNYYIEDYTGFFIIVTILGLFIISLGSCIKSCIQEKLVK